MAGIHRPFLNIGMPLTSFAFHLEDGDLCSINHLHFGKPKLWYFVSGVMGAKLEQLSKKLTSEMCQLFIRHKKLMIPPSLLQKHGIRFARVNLNHSQSVRTRDSVHCTAYMSISETQMNACTVHFLSECTHLPLTNR